MKALGHSSVWWPKLDEAISEWVGRCETCQASRAAPPMVPARKWEKPQGPWSRLHLDFTGPIQGTTILVVVDAFSKWIEIVPMLSTTMEATIRDLQRLFTCHGIPDLVVSGNGPQWTSAMFQAFLATLGVRQALISPYHPASNGWAKREVRLVKEALDRMGTGNLQDKINHYLLAQHTTPCPISNRPPAELLMGQRLRTILDRLHPHYASCKPLQREVTGRQFAVGEWVFALNFSGIPNWVPATIMQITGPCSYRSY